MRNNTSRILIETIVKKTLADIQEAPQRSIRNLIDMALYFSNGRFQRSFFAMAQTMLQKETSAYYGLIEDIANHVDSERIFRFGMNVGYNSCTLGARTIREIEAKEGYNIPWIISLYIDSQTFSDKLSDYQRILSQGESIGVYTWILFPSGYSKEIVSLIQEHPNCAFALFCNPKDGYSFFIHDIAACKNVMLVIQYREDTAKVCDLLRKEKMLYSVYYCYQEKDMDDIRKGRLFDRIQQLHPVFTALMADSACTEDSIQQIYQVIKQNREQQLFQTVLWEIEYDSNAVDSVISSEPCSAKFDAAGYLMIKQNNTRENTLNLFENDLSSVLKQAFPKQKR